MTKKIALVLGCGASGVAAAGFLSRRDWEVVVCDTRKTPSALAELQEKVPGARFVPESLDPSLLEGAELVVASPGLSLDHSQASALVAKARETGIEVIGEIELFARGLAELKATQGYEPAVVGITGTNGKTTTTTLVGRMVAASGLSVCVAGNIGPNAVAELDKAIDAGKLPAVWVLELSSFQLASTSSLHCKSAAFLNLTQDHVDWHGSMQAYEEAKLRIFTSGTTRVLNREDEASMRASKTEDPVQTFGGSAPTQPGQWGVVSEEGMEWLACVPPRPDGQKHRRSSILAEDPIETMRLMPVAALKIRGRHNVMNALAALALATSAGATLAGALQGLKDYAGEPHRVQHILTTERGVEFIDDSKGTNVGATVAALAGLGAGGQKCSIILGGDGKGQDFSPIATAIAAHARFVALIGRDADKIEEAIRNTGVPMASAGFDFDRAVDMAAAAAKPGDVVLLSPACASWDMFKNYAERSARFVHRAEEIAKREAIHSED